MLQYLALIAYVIFIYIYICTDMCVERERGEGERAGLTCSTPACMAITSSNNLWIWSFYLLFVLFREFETREKKGGRKIAFKEGRRKPFAFVFITKQGNQPSHQFLPIF